MERVFAALDEYHKSIEHHGVETGVAVLTSAVRDSANGEQFAAEVQRRYGLEPHVLTGDQEATLTYLGATSERDPGDMTPTLVLDIGGGSTEMVIGSGHEASFPCLDPGRRRAPDRAPPAHRPADRVRAARDVGEDVREILVAAVPSDKRRAVQHGIGVAGTATQLAAIAQELEPYDAARVHGYELTADEAERLLARLGKLAGLRPQRREVTGLDPGRAPTIVAGALILVEVLEPVGLDRIEVSEHDLLRGAALGLGANCS